MRSRLVNQSGTGTSAALKPSSPRFALALESVIGADIIKSASHWGMQRSRPRLAFKAVVGLVRRDLRLHLPRLSHPAFAEQRDDFIGAELVARGKLGIRLSQLIGSETDWECKDAPLVNSLRPREVKKP